MPKKTDKLNKRQVFAIPKLLESKSIGEIAKQYGVSWQAIWYHIKRLREQKIKVITRKSGQQSVIYQKRSATNK